MIHDYTTCSRTNPIIISTKISTKRHNDYVLCEWMFWLVEMHRPSTYIILASYGTLIKSTWSIWLYPTNDQSTEGIGHTCSLSVERTQWKIHYLLILCRRLRALRWKRSNKCDVLQIAADQFGGLQEWFDGKCRTKVVKLKNVCPVGILNTPHHNSPWFVCTKV